MIAVCTFLLAVLFALALPARAQTGHILQFTSDIVVLGHGAGGSRQPAVMGSKN